MHKSRRIRSNAMVHITVEWHHAYKRATVRMLVTEHVKRESLLCFSVLVTARGPIYGDIIVCVGRLCWS